MAHVQAGGLHAGADTVVQTDQELGVLADVDEEVGGAVDDDQEVGQDGQVVEDGVVTEGVVDVLLLEAHDKLSKVEAHLDGMAEDTDEDDGH